jgi:hypothetical protein
LPRTKIINYTDVLPVKKLSSEEEIDEYVKAFREELLAKLEPGGSIRLGK